MTTSPKPMHVGAKLNGPLRHFFTEIERSGRFKEIYFSVIEHLNEHSIGHTEIAPKGNIAMYGYWRFIAGNGISKDIPDLLKVLGATNQRDFINDVIVDTQNRLRSRNPNVQKFVEAQLDRITQAVVDKLLEEYMEQANKKGLSSRQATSADGGVGEAISKRPSRTRSGSPPEGNDL